MTKMTLTSKFLSGVPMIWTKTDEATASSASIVATAMGRFDCISPIYGLADFGKIDHVYYVKIAHR